MNEQVKILYQPTTLVEIKTLKIKNMLMKHNLKKHYFKKGIPIGKPKLYVKFIELDPFSEVLVHWYPLRSESLRQDPYCSALILRYNSLEKIYRILADELNDKRAIY